MKQPDDASSSRIERRNVTSFEAIAVEIGPGQIVEAGGAAMFLRNDVIRFVREESITLMNQTVFAAL